MPSPFPGMDPFIEGQKWTDFHTEFISDLRAALVPLVSPGYATHVEERVYIEHQNGDPPSWVRPDVVLSEASPSSPARGGVATLEAPATARIPMPERRREVYLELRLREGGDVVTVVEVLSPTNKRPGSDGNREYRTKRDAVLLSTAHLVEIDLLRGDERLPMVDPLPVADFYATVSHASRRPTCNIWYWNLPDPLPSIRIPLRHPDPDVVLDLQRVFTGAYDRAGYAYSLGYDRDVTPELNAEAREWVRARVAAWEPARQPGRDSPPQGLP